MAFFNFTKRRIRSQQDATVATEPFSLLPNPVERNLSRLYASSKSLSDSTDSLHYFVKNSLENMETVSYSINAILQSAEQQATEVSQSLIDSESLGQVLNRSEEQIHHMEDAAKQSLEASRSVQAAVHSLGEQAVANAATSDDLNETMEKLASKSNQISKAVELIFQVSGSIQILSLNASIEAARAGEEGKGFAVVAAEIRRLSQESAANGEEIRKSLQDIQRHIQDLGEVVKKTKESSRDIYKAVEATKTEFDVIREKLSQVVTHTEEVSSQLSFAGERKDILIRNLNQVSALAQQSAASAHDIANLSEAQSSSVLSVAGATQDIQAISVEIESGTEEIVGPLSDNYRADAKAKKIRIGYIANLAQAPALLAIQNGIFDEAFEGGAEMRAFSAGPALVDALASGQIDIGYTGPGPAFQAISRQAKIRILSGVSQGGSALVVKKAAGISALEQLKGKTIAIPQFGNGQHILLRQLLRRNGLKDVFRGGDIRIVQAKPSELARLFGNDQAAAALLPEPWVTLLINGGTAEVLLDWKDLYNDGNYPNAVIAVNEYFYESRPEAVDTFLKAHKQSLNAILDGKGDVFGMLSQALERLTGQGLTPEAIAIAMKRIVWNSDARSADLDGYAELIGREGFLKKPFA